MNPYICEVIIRAIPENFGIAFTDRVNELLSMGYVVKTKIHEPVIDPNSHSGDIFSATIQAFLPAYADVIILD